MHLALLHTQLFCQLSLPLDDLAVHLQTVAMHPLAEQSLLVPDNSAAVIGTAAEVAACWYCTGQLVAAPCQAAPAGSEADLLRRFPLQKAHQAGHCLAAACCQLGMRSLPESTHECQLHLRLAALLLSAQLTLAVLLVYVTLPCVCHLQSLHQAALTHFHQLLQLCPDADHKDFLSFLSDLEQAFYVSFPVLLLAESCSPQLLRQSHLLLHANSLTAS